MRRHCRGCELSSYIHDAETMHSSTDEGALAAQKRDEVEFPTITSAQLPVEQPVIRSDYHYQLNVQSNLRYVFCLTTDTIR